MDSDSATETESDFDDPQNLHTGETECPLKSVAASTSSDGEQPAKRGKGRKPNSRDPYRLRKAAKLEPLKEDEVKTSDEGVESSGRGLGALLTPPSSDTPTIKPPTNPPPPPPSSKDTLSQIPNPTPPETPHSDSHSDIDILKRMLSQEESTVDNIKKSQSALDSSSKKKPPVSSRTRAQTKFENVRSQTLSYAVSVVLCDVCLPSGNKESGQERQKTK